MIDLFGLTRPVTKIIEVRLFALASQVVAADANERAREIRAFTLACLVTQCPAIDVYGNAVPVSTIQ